MPLLTLPPTPARNYNVQSFDSTSTFTVPTSSTGFIDIIMVGGGGGGGRSNNTGEGGGGGAGGQVVFLQNVAVPLGQVITVTIGAGGAGATSAGNDGVNGSDTTVTNLGALTFATSFTSSGGARGVTKSDNTGIRNQTVYGYFPNASNYWGPSSSQSTVFSSINTWSASFNSNQGPGGSGQSTPNWFPSVAPLVGPSTVSLSSDANPGFYGFLPKAYQTKQGTAGSTGTNAGGPSTASTTLFAGRGAHGGIGAQSGGTGLYGAGGGGGGSNSGPTQAGAAGNGAANSGAGGGGGGGNSATAGNSGNGGTGGSGFVVIGYWG
jgi:hypothetical protein